MSTDLEFVGQLIHVATIFVIISSIPPNEAHLVCKSIPSLEVRDIGRRRTTVLTASSFRHTFQTNAMLDDLVVVLEFARRQVSEREIYLKTPVILLGPDLGIQPGI